MASSGMMMTMPPDSPPNLPADVGPPNPEGQPALPVRSQDDTDVGWGERPEPDDDERLYRERPPHWDSV